MRLWESYFQNCHIILFKGSSFQQKMIRHVKNRELQPIHRKKHSVETAPEEDFNTIYK